MNRLYSQAGNYLFKVNDGNSRVRCKLCSKLTKTQERRQWRASGVFIVNFEHISHLILVFLLLILSFNFHLRNAGWERSSLALSLGYRRRIVGKEIDFEELASQFSDCSSARNGGDLGFFGPGQMQGKFYFIIYWAQNQWQCFAQILEHKFVLPVDILNLTPWFKILRRPYLLRDHKEVWK